MMELLQKIPKSELHVHLRGAIPIEVINVLWEKHTAKKILEDIPAKEKLLFRFFKNIRPFLSENHWSRDTTPDLFRYKSFIQFLITYYFTRYLIKDKSDLKLLIKGVLERLKSQNIVYVEITISIIDYLKRGFTLEEVKECLDEFTSFPGIQVQWIVDLVRNIGEKSALASLEDIINLKFSNIIGITLGGYERFYPPKKFLKVYSKARENGLHLTIHAGEGLGPKSVWDSINLLGVERIGHGVRAVEDVLLVKYLAKNKIPLEISPTSNIKTGIYSSYQEHPVRKLFDAGVQITINTDDPTFFNTTLVDEYLHVYNMGLGEKDIYTMIRNGFLYSFLQEDKINKYLKDLDNKWGNLKGFV